jgi:hypothetical protein
LPEAFALPWHLTSLPQVEQNLASGDSREPLRGACRQRLGQPPDVSHLGGEKPEGEIRSYSPVHMRSDANSSRPPNILTHSCKFADFARMCQYPKMPSQHILMTEIRPLRRIDKVALQRWALPLVE